MKPLIDKIEAFGRAVDEGLIAPDEATAELAEVSGGGLTELGARTVIDDWKSARRRYRGDGEAQSAGAAPA